MISASLAALLCAAAPSVTILGQVGDATAKPGWVYAKRGQSVTLQAKVTGATATGYRWLQLEPTVASVDNTQPSFHFAPISYQSTELASCRNQASCPVTVAPTVLPKVESLPGVGTMAYQLVVTTEHGELKTPGLESTKWGGLTDAVMRVTVRRDDTYLGYLTELINTPYIFGSAGPDGRNQSDLLIGSDCADLAVYGRRRMGKKNTYTSSYGIDAQAPELTRGEQVAHNGQLLDTHARPIEFGAKGVREGDLIHFPNSRHVGVLWEDREPKGVLDTGDLMIHTCWAAPTIEPIGATSCASLPWRVLRFKP